MSTPRIHPPEPEWAGPAAHVMHDGAGPLENMPVRQWILHATVSPCVAGGRYNIAAMFRTTAEFKSAHYVVDPAGAVQVVGDHQVAEHCGHNPHTLSLELCDPQAGPGTRWNDSPHERMLRRASRIVARGCLAYGIPVRRLTVDQLRADVPGIAGHADVTAAFPLLTDHTDPGPDFPWPRFMSYVETHATYLLRLAKGHTP